jgi:tetratricopeptide (TPR) repeat protein
MNARILTLLLAPVLLQTWDALVPAPSPEELVRRGNAAYERDDYEAAVAMYTQAEGRITDPGLAAFNKAAALYRRGQFRDAELQYRCSLEGAAGPRRARGLFGLGNALLQQSSARGADVLRDAIRCYEACLRQPELEQDLADDARHNLELAKLLLAQAPPKAPKPPDEQPDDHQDKPKPPDREPDTDPGGEQAAPGSPDQGNQKQRVKRDQGQDPQPSDDAAPGAGTRPPVPDQPELAPLTREDAENYLKEKAAAILKERREFKNRRGHGMGNPLDR